MHCQVGPVSRCTVKWGRKLTICQVGPTCLKHNLTPVDDHFNRPSGPLAIWARETSHRIQFASNMSHKIQFASNVSHRSY
uniref:Uncharacterized protein n=1 Tax=Hordeum vulgare subsp. vulgare TaxID=112509 RepID=A0A8I6YK82_HORVV